MGRLKATGKQYGKKTPGNSILPAGCSWRVNPAPMKVAKVGQACPGVIPMTRAFTAERAAQPHN